MDNPQVRHPAPSPPVGALPWLRWWPFIILAAAAAVVIVTARDAPPTMRALAGVWLLTLALMLAVAIFLEWAARACLSRQRLASGFDASPEAARAILDATAGLTRVVNVAVTVYVALLVMPRTWVPGVGVGRSLGIGMVVIVTAIVWAVWALKAVHGHLERTGQLGGLEGWNGFTYNNPNDPRLWVPKLSGLGATLNFAHTRSWLILGAILVPSIGGAIVAIIAVNCR